MKIVVENLIIAPLFRLSKQPEAGNRFAHERFIGCVRLSTNKKADQIENIFFKNQII